MKRVLVVALCAVVLSGCAGLANVFLPTPVACAPKDSPSPPKTISNTLLKKLDDRAFVFIVSAERLELLDYAGKADAIIQACKQ